MTAAPVIALRPGRSLARPRGSRATADRRVADRAGHLEPRPSRRGRYRQARPVHPHRLDCGLRGRGAAQRGGPHVTPGPSVPAPRFRADRLAVHRRLASARRRAGDRRPGCAPRLPGRTGQSRYAGGRQRAPRPAARAARAALAGAQHLDRGRDHDHRQRHQPSPGRRRGRETDRR